MNRTRRCAPPIRLGLLVPLVLAPASCTLPAWPVQGPVGSEFGVRFRGLLPEIHRGVDIRVPVGTPVRAMADGRVRFAGTQGAYGTVIWLDHGAQVLSVYAHLSDVSVSAGQAVEARQVIGLSGASGNASGPHLHFEIWRWGREQDPVGLLGGLPGG